MRATDGERKAWSDHLDEIHKYMSQQFGWKIGERQIMARGSILKDICLPWLIQLGEFCLALLLWWICLTIWLDVLGIDLISLIQTQPGV